MKNLLLILSVATGTMLAMGQTTVQIPLQSKYSAPAKVWSEEALPIGNGYMGAMIFGGVKSEKIQTNEKTLWSGGPNEDPNYNGGHLHSQASAHAALQNFRRTLQDNMTAVTERATPGKASDYPGNDHYYNEAIGFDDYKPGDTPLNGLLGTKDHFGSFQTLSEIKIDDINPTHDDAQPAWTNYVRSLDIDNAVQHTSYNLDGANYTRDYFMSYPDNVMVMHLSTDGGNKMSRRFSITAPQSDCTVAVNDDNQIVLIGYPEPVSDVKTRRDDYRDFLRFAQVLGINSTDGKVSTDGKTITVSDASYIDVVMSSATNYNAKNFTGNFDNFIDRTVNPEQKAKGFVDAAKGKSYDDLYATHTADYHRLYNANKINLGNTTSVPEATTDELLAKLQEGTISDAERNYLETLYYQFGRYLLIASSRPGSLPANLQGVWCDRLANDWNADYHTNINVQMNYWPAEQTNLSECHIPMTDLVRTLEPFGRATAQQYHVKPDGTPIRDNAWTTYHEVNAWGNTAPAARGTHCYFPEGAIWICQDIWEHYLFTQDKEFLKEHYPTLLNACLFWVDNLWEDERDGSLVASPSLSPEHGEFSLGATATQGILYEMFSAAIKGSEILGAYQKEAKEIADARARLSMPKIGEVGGQFMEWKDEINKDLTGDAYIDGNGKSITHRHTNHLFWLHPGSQIVPGRSAEEDRYVDGMKVTLNTRGDEGTGWSRAWKLNFWARLRDGNRAHSLLKGCLNLTKNGGAGGVFKNLFDAHPPFQIDGNFGVTSGIAEMLIQSQGDAIEILPALPDAWKDGSFEGMRARGGFEVSADWTDGAIRNATVKRVAGDNKTVKVKFPGAGAKNIKVSGGKVKRLSPNEIEITLKGNEAKISCI